MGPYGIQMFDAGQVINTYDKAQDRRVNQMLAQRKIRIEDEKLARDRETRDAKGAIFDDAPTPSPAATPSLASQYAPTPQAAHDGNTPVRLSSAYGSAGTLPSPSLSSPYANRPPVDPTIPVGSPLSPATIDPSRVAPQPGTTITAFASDAKDRSTLPDYPPQHQPGGININMDALRRLAHAGEPQLAMHLYTMNAQARSATYDRLTKAVDLEGRIIGAVRAVPKADREEMYQSLRSQYAAPGDEQAWPQHWDDDHAIARQRLGLSVVQSFNDDRAERRLTNDIQDDALDNRRADRNTDSVIGHRVAEEGISRRGQDMTDARGRYGISVSSGDRHRAQDIESTDRRRGQDLSASRPRGRGGAAPKVYVNAQGHAITWDGKAWVDAK